MNSNQFLTKQLDSKSVILLGFANYFPIVAVYFNYSVNCFKIIHSIFTGFDFSLFLYLFIVILKNWKNFLCFRIFGYYSVVVTMGVMFNYFKEVFAKYFNLYSKIKKNFVKLCLITLYLTFLDRYCFLITNYLNFTP